MEPLQLCMGFTVCCLTGIGLEPISLGHEPNGGRTIAVVYVRKLQELRPSICTLSGMAEE